MPVFIGPVKRGSSDALLGLYPDALPKLNTPGTSGRTVRKIVSEVLMAYGPSLLSPGPDFAPDELRMVVARAVSLLPTGSDAERAERRAAQAAATDEVRRRQLADYLELGKRLSSIAASGEVIGTGGSGAIVYRGRLRDDEPFVAVKAISGANSTSLKLFRNEADLLSGLDHPNVVSPLLSYTMGSECFLVLPYCNAGSMHEPSAEAKVLLQDGRKLLVLLGGIAKGLTYLHDRGIIHRDVKPGNVLLSITQEGALLPLVCDLGISRASAETVAGTAAAGTYGFIAPDRGMVSPKNDVYALGVMQLMALTGRPAYSKERRGNKVVDVMLDDAVRADRRPAVQQATREVAWPSAHGAEELLEGLLRLALRCTELDRARRPSMREVSLALADLLLPGGGSSCYFSQADMLTAPEGESLKCTECDAADRNRLPAMPSCGLLQALLGSPPGQCPAQPGGCTLPCLQRAGSIC